MSSVSLRVADSISWHTAPGYSLGTARALRRAYALLRAGRRDLRGYIAAYKCLAPHLKRPMARHQRLRAAYVMAMAHAAVGDCSAAIAWCDEALALTYELAIPSARIDLLYLCGQCRRAVQRFHDSAADHRQALGIYRQLARQGELPDEAPDDALEMELLTQLAGTEFYLGEYATVQRRLDDAIAIRRRTRIDPLVAANVEWMEAHLYRWRRLPALALQPALVAAQIFTEAGAPASAARIQTFTADIQLDFAEGLPDGSDRDAQIATASEHLTLAQELAAEAHDDTGACLTLLTEIRYSRMAGENEGRLAVVQDIIHAAGRLGDDVLQAQAYTTLGDELAALNRLDAALRCYDQSLDMLIDGEVPALAVWAQSAMHRAREQRDD